MSLQLASQAVSRIVVDVLVFWTVALFFSIGIFAESGSSVVLTALAFGAFGIFLLLELGMPYNGIFRVPPAAVEQTLRVIGR